ncbi:MAG: UDP-N-acetylglucosamine 2-epimerase [Brevundimonas sp.]|uniref:UDP-N-acetylglucosamine 2-epimerase n=1 Tax=Brevundimonas sp. TaxID=1871086 RepID=UPI0039187871
MTGKACVITGSRADYGLMSRMMRQLASAGRLQLLVTGAHLDEANPTEGEILSDGFVIDSRVPLPPTGYGDLETARAVGFGVGAIAEVLNNLKPGVAVILGDRFEALAAAQAAFFLNIPVAHIHGGEVTVGSLDDSTRHAISKLARWHFVSNAQARDRLIRMGEEPGAVFVSGAPGLDDLRSLQPLSLQALASDLGWDAPAPFLLVTYHPVTNLPGETDHGIRALLAVLEELPFRVVVTGSNADAGGHAVNQALASFARSHDTRVRIRSSLGRHRYLSAMHHALAVVGNSSSGIVEAPFLGKPTVNIGTRQEGRPCASSIINCSSTIESIRDAIGQALDPDFRESARSAGSLYGNGDSSARIFEKLIDLIDAPPPGPKRFHDT